MKNSFLEYDYLFPPDSFRTLPAENSSVTSDPLRDWLKTRLPNYLTFTGQELRRRGISYYNEVPQEISPFVDVFARFIVAFTGGLSLVVPMLIMRLGENLTKSLVTVSVAVLLFSGVTSIMFKASNVETLAATAAYAAVLVVFVGTSGH